MSFVKMTPSKDVTEGNLEKHLPVKSVSEESSDEDDEESEESNGECK